MRVNVALIGGTGIGDRLLSISGQPIHIPTPFGTIRGRIIRIADESIVVFSRHSAGHKVPPHRVPYLGIAWACKRLEVRACFSTAAVGSLREDWPSGTLVNCSDFIDFSCRNLTRFDKTVEHVDFSEPFAPGLRKELQFCAKELGLNLKPNGIYLNLNGPRYETPHEVKSLRAVGDIVGMTAGSEAIAMRETGVRYSCLAIVTNLAAGISQTPLSHEEVVAQMKISGESAVKLLLAAAKKV
jgi:5'-methylthioadenosine phosphorylase